VLPCRAIISVCPSIRFGSARTLHHFQEALAETERRLKRVFVD